MAFYTRLRCRDLILIKPEVELAELLALVDAEQRVVVGVERLERIIVFLRMMETLREVINEINESRYR